MVGVSPKNKGGMWTVVENYINHKEFVEQTQLKYIPTVTKANPIFKVLFSVKAIYKVARELKCGNYDLIHINMSERGSVYRTNIIEKIASKYGVKKVIHMHGAEFQTWYEALEPKKQCFVKNTLDMSDKILILGNYWREFVGSLVSNKEKISVLYNAVQVPEKNSYNSQSRNILFLGLVGKRKGIFDIIESVKKLKELECNVKLLVYGPDETNGFQAIIDSNNINDFIEYRGWLSNEDKEDIFKDVFVNLLPSYNEGLPMTILETMAHGIPNISTKVAAIPEVVNEKNGYLLEPGDVEGIVASILDLRNNAQSKSDVAFRTIKEEYALDVHIEKLLHVYGYIVGKGV